MFELFEVSDPALDEVETAIRQMDPDGSRWAAVIRHTYDSIYNGAETGRFRWAQLMKTERTHFGTVFEIYAQREFKFLGGDTTDYRIAGHQVDAKWSQTDGGWMLPPEVFGEIALVATGSDIEAEFSLGLVRVRDEYLRESVNRDKKSSLNTLGRRSIRWIWKNRSFPHNILLRLPNDVLDDIFGCQYGTERINRLFRATEGRLVHRSSVLTVGQQLDALRRVRAGGGARGALQSEGYIILSAAHAYLAEPLGVPVPDDKHFVSVRVAPADDGHGALIAGSLWRRATLDDPPHDAPTLPKRGVRE
ncbi:NaeI family type II restriction endonuclease [Nocardia rhamnosiphila]|uniref:NaeI family type II restriction endonuclease n=1 Tax=Nocardia rhamnosiphila TaxID=426716 RepID=UPI0033C99CFB